MKRVILLIGQLRYLVLLTFQIDFEAEDFFYNQNKMHKKFYQTIHLLRRHHVIKIDALTTK